MHHGTIIGGFRLYWYGVDERGDKNRGTVRLLEADNTRANHGSATKQPSRPLCCGATQALRVPVVCAPRCYNCLLSQGREAYAQKEVRLAIFTYFTMVILGRRQRRPGAKAFITTFISQYSLSAENASDNAM
eukprot:5884670-Pleurochrysis_carterae.AAC.1